MVLHEAKYEQADSATEFLPLALTPYSYESFPDLCDDANSVCPMPIFAFGDTDEDEEDMEEDNFDDMEEEDFDDDEEEDFDDDEEDDEDEEDEEDYDDDDDDDFDYDDDDDDDFDYDDE